MNSELRCRTCLKPEINMKPIYDCDTELNIRFIHLIQHISNIEIIENDGFPATICVNCINELKQAYKFVVQIQISDNTLRNCGKVNTENCKNRSVKTFICGICKNLYTGDDAKNNFHEENLNILNINNFQDTINLIGDDKNSTKDEYNSIDNENKLKEIIEESNDASLNEDDLTFSDDEDEVSSSKNFETEIISRQKPKLDGRKRNNYACKICEKTFTNKKLLNKHLYSHQELSTLYRCEHCNKDFKKIAHLNVHLRSHIADDEKAFQCPKCDRKFTFEYLLKQHMHKHAETKPFPCPKCKKGCLTEDSLKRHMKVHEKDYTKPKYTCTVCQKEFEYPSFLAEHMKNHTGEKSFLCAFCGKMFRHKGAFQYHVRVHDGTRPFQCRICDKSFTARGILKVHLRCHTNERPYICDMCGKGFRQCTDMKSHKRTHTGDKTVECSVCHKKLAQRGQLKIHMRTHTGEKPFGCNQCGREFATNTMLIKHTRIHTGEKPYVCQICGKAFAQSNTLKAHQKVHAKDKDITV